MKEDYSVFRPYNPEEGIDYDKERIYTTDQGAKVVVPLEGIIKWQQKRYQREIGELKAYIDELQDTNQTLIKKCEKYNNKVEELKETIRGLKADIRENPYYIEKVAALQNRNVALMGDNKRLKKVIAELLAKLNSRGIDATVNIALDVNEAPNK